MMHTARNAATSKASTIPENLGKQVQGHSTLQGHLGLGVCFLEVTLFASLV